MKWRLSRDQSCRQTAFTLLELLIVVVVISLLAALILPAIYRMRESARSAQCTSNLRQLYAAAMNFSTTGGRRSHFPHAVTFDVWDPVYGWGRGGNGWVHWDDDHDQNPTAWRGDAATNSIRQGTLWAHIDHSYEMYICPTFKLFAATKWNAPDAHRSYVMNRRMSSQNLFSIVDASRHALFADGNYNKVCVDSGDDIAEYGFAGGQWYKDRANARADGIYFGPRQFDGRLEGNRHGNTTRPLETYGSHHGGFGNMVFADGHTERLEQKYEDAAGDEQSLMIMIDAGDYMPGFLP